MRLNEYITEDQSRSKEINDKKFIELLNKKCSVAYNSKSRKIYRGVRRGEPFLFVDPTKKTPRTAKNAVNNIYNLLFSNHVSWADYPKRNKSIVCTTSYDKAMGYGSIYEVYPFDGAKIGVCPEEDLWKSFKGNFSTMSLNGVTRIIEDVIDDVAITQYRYNATYEDIVEMFDSIDENIINRKNSIHYHADFFKTIGYIKDNKRTKKRFIDCITDKLSPDNNDFSVRQVGAKLPSNVEVWTDSPCVLMRSDYEIK